MIKKGRALPEEFERKEERKEEYQLMSQFKSQAELMIAKQAQFVKIWRLRIGAIYLLLNFTKGSSTSTLIPFISNALPSVFDMKLRIKPKIYHSQNNREALNVMNILRKDYVRMLITKLPNTFLKHSFATFFGMKHSGNEQQDGNGKRTLKHYKQSMARKLTSAKQNMLIEQEQALEDEEEMSS